MPKYTYYIPCCWHLCQRCYRILINTCWPVRLGNSAGLTIHSSIMQQHCCLSAARGHVCVRHWGAGHQHSSCMQETKEKPVHAALHECIHHEGWEYTQTHTVLRLLMLGMFKALCDLHCVQEHKRLFIHTRRLLSWPLCCFLARSFASHTKRWSRGFAEGTQAQISGGILSVI